MDLTEAIAAGMRADLVVFLGYEPLDPSVWNPSEKQEKSVRAIITAALPHIREQIARDIEHVSGILPAPNDPYSEGMQRAAAIVRGDT